MDKLDLNSFTKEQIAMASQCETQKHLMRLLGGGIPSMCHTDKSSKNCCSAKMYE